MILFLLGAGALAVALGLAYIVRDLIARPAAPAEQHQCWMCHDRGALLNSQGRPIVCPSLPCRRRFSHHKWSA